MCRTRRLLAVLLAVLVVAAACGDDDDAVEETPTPTATPVVDGADDDGDDEEPEPTPSPTPTPGPAWPLTGLPIDDSDLELAQRPALTVKMDNHPDALPQWGLNDADVVIEILVEGITRLAAVYHSGDADPVGPVRSGRSSDPAILANFGRPLLAWSGGNPTVLGMIAEAQAQGLLIDVGSFPRPDLYYRFAGREMPHNLLSSTPALFGAAPDNATPPPELFTFRAPADQRSDRPGEQVAGVTIVFTGAHRADFAWDEDRGGWVRWQNRRVHVDMDLEPAVPANVVILETPYGVSAADPVSPEAQTIGSGVAWVFSEGHRQQGRWERPSIGEPWRLVAGDGTPLTLVPGLTWIELVQPGGASLMDRDTAATLLDGLPGELEALRS